MTSTVKLFAIIFETLLFLILGSQFDQCTLPDIWDFDLAVLLLITVARFNMYNCTNMPKCFPSRLIVACSLCLVLNRLRTGTGTT